MSEGSDSVLDMATIDELRLLADDDDPGFLSELIDTFLGELTPCLEAIAQAVEADDAEAVRRAAHRLKGSASNIGAAELADRCAALEAAHAAGAETKQVLLSEIRAASTRTVAALTALRGES